MDPAQQQAVIQTILQGDYVSLYSSYLAQAPTMFAGLNLPKRLMPIRGQPGTEGVVSHGLAYTGRLSSTVDFPVRKLKYLLLKDLLPKSAFFYTANYDINVVSPQQGISVVEQAFLVRFMKEGVQVLLSIFLPSTPEFNHAVAGFLVPSGTLYVVNTSITDPLHLMYIKQMIDAYTGRSITVVDVMAGVGLNLQDYKDDLFCVTWMLLALKNNGNGPVTPDGLETYLKTMKSLKDAQPGNEFIIQLLEQLKGIYNSSGGKRKMIQEEAKGSCGSTTRKAGHRRTKKWIQKVVKKMEKGAFTKQSMRHGETPLEYAKDVLAHPTKHTLKTRRRAQFLKNISRRK